MSKASELFVRKSSGLVKTVTARDAFISNLVGMGILINIFWVVFASASYPGADLTATVFTGLAVNLLVAYVYWMLSTSMPRTGGDYVWVGRIIHPGVAFMVNAMFVVLMVTWAGVFPFFNSAYNLQILFTNLGMATGNAAFTGMATALTDTNTIFVVSMATVALVVLTMLLSTKNIFRIVIALFALQAVIYVVFMGMMVTTNHAVLCRGFQCEVRNDCGRNREEWNRSPRFAYHLHS